MQKMEFEGWKALLNIEKAEDEKVSACANADFNTPVTDVINLLYEGKSTEEMFFDNVTA